MKKSLQVSKIVVPLYQQTETDMQIVKTIIRNNNQINIVRVVKPGTKRVFFFPVTSDNKRLNTTLYARQWSAEDLGVSYLKSI